MDTQIHRIATSIISRRKRGFPEPEALFEAACNKETKELLALAAIRATFASDVEMKTAALAATPFVTNGMVDAPAPGEKELLVSLLADWSVS